MRTVALKLCLTWWTKGKLALFKAVFHKVEKINYLLLYGSIWQGTQGVWLVTLKQCLVRWIRGVICQFKAVFDMQDRQGM